MIRVGAAPTPSVSSDLKEVGDLASYPCYGGSVDNPSAALSSASSSSTSTTLSPSSSITSTASSSTIDEAPFLADLKVTQLESIDYAKAAIKATAGWVGFDRDSQKFAGYVKLVSDKLTVKLIQHSGLSAEQNSRLHVLLQLANYAYFLDSVEQEAASDSGNDNEIKAVKNVRITLMRMQCSLRQLLPRLTNVQIQAFTHADVNGHTLSVKGRNETTRWVVCNVALEVILHTLENIEVSSGSLSVIERDSS